MGNFLSAFQEDCIYWCQHGCYAHGREYKSVVLLAFSARLSELLRKRISSRSLFLVSPYKAFSIKCPSLLSFVPPLYHYCVPLLGSEFRAFSVWWRGIALLRTDCSVPRIADHLFIQILVHWAPNFNCCVLKEIRLSSFWLRLWHLDQAFLDTHHAGCGYLNHIWKISQYIHIPAFTVDQFFHQK